MAATRATFDSLPLPFTIHWMWYARRRLIRLTALSYMCMTDTYG